MLLHASCVAINGRGVLLAGLPGVGKSDLALRLVDDGAQFVADDQTLLQCENKTLIAMAPSSICGLIEIRHIGLAKIDFIASAPVTLYVELTSLGVPLERLPEPDRVFFLDQPVQRLTLPSFAASTPAKIRAALSYVFLQ